MGKIDLNTLFNNKPFPTKEKIFKYITSYQLFSFYLNKKIEIGKSMISPFIRNNGQYENNPSFSLFTINTGELLYNDFTGDSGDIVKFINRLYSYPYYLQGIKRILIDFNLENNFEKLNLIKLPNEKPINNFKISKKEMVITPKKKIYITERDWEMHDLKYWGTYGISLLNLKQHDVYPIKQYIIYYNKLPQLYINTGPFAYAYKEEKDNEITYKIYRPFSKNWKWYTNNDNSVLQGWELLPKTGHTLIITKSLKDVMVIKNVLNLPSIAVQNEKSKIKSKVMDELVSRFIHIYLLFDNDFNKSSNWGQIFAKNLIHEFKDTVSLHNLLISETYQVSDISDMYKKHGPDEIKKYFDNKILITPF